VNVEWPALSERRGFGSDNHSGIHPRILAAIARANVGHVPSYGTDDLTAACLRMFREMTTPKAEAFFVFNGTAANVLSLSSVMRSFHAVLSTTNSHLYNDECGALENIVGAKNVVVPTSDGKLTPALLKPLLIRGGDQHASQINTITLTQPTEIGTVYSLDEIAAIKAFARENKLKLHLDGARLVNAAAALGCTPGRLMMDFDVVSFGGTKNALMFGEAVVFPHGLLNDDFKYLRKQYMQLPSKTRFVAAQFLEFLGTDLWLENAKHANAMARRLSEGLSKSKYAKLTQKTEANGCFVQLPKKLVAKLREHSFFYVWDEHTFECRLMTSWDTQIQDVDQFLSNLERLGAENA
jgi:threonine aldolase